ncbi:cation diffusion facilitator family transporter [Euzebya sp.]|uniref:cation diffusion facilitator family transporter n=1 Tax=Euzebya sp. TaxID=1971409 RepID=UPI0035138981
MGEGSHAGHDHGSAAGAARGGAAYTRRLLIAFGLIGAFFVVELVGGLLTNSLALLSDAGHMLTDVIGLGMALAAIQAANAGSRQASRTFGLYRLEILAALANAVLLFGVAIYILYEAVQRLTEPPEVLGTPMLVVAVLGLAVNLVVFAMLRSGAAESLNVEGAYLEVMADTLGSVGVIIAAGIIEVTGFTLADPIFGVLIGLFVLPRTYRLGAKALRILIQAAPAHIDVEGLEDDLGDLDEVAAVHDLHVWTLTSGMEVASVHLRLTGGCDDGASHRVLDAARHLMREHYGLGHATIQVEPAEHHRCEDPAETSW